MAEDGVEIFVDDNAYGDPRAWSHYPGEDPHEMGLNDTVRELRIALARLTEVEAERDHWMNLAIDRGDQVAPALGGTDAVITRARKAEARLAAVEAVFGERDCPNGYESDEPGCGCYICLVRAAARGEGDRD